MHAQGEHVLDEEKPHTGFQTHDFLGASQQCCHVLETNAQNFTSLQLHKITYITISYYYYPFVFG